MLYSNAGGSSQEAEGSVPESDEMQGAQDRGVSTSEEAQLHAQPDLQDEGGGVLVEDEQQYAQPFDYEGEESTNFQFL